MRRVSSSCLAVIFILLLSGCDKPFVVACREIGQDPNGSYKYTARQAAVACEIAHFFADSNLFIYDKIKKTFSLNPNGLLAADLEKVLRDEAKSLDALLSYKSRRNADFIDWPKGFRAGLEKEEKVILEVLRRLNYVRAYNEFTDAVGELPNSMQTAEFSYFFPNGRKFYSMRLIYPRPEKALELIPFTAEYFEAAKQAGTLKLVDTLDVSDSREFAKKIPDLYDANDFSWQQSRRGWVIKSYKVMLDADKPLDNVTHYVEIFRKKPDLAAIEPLPAIRGFMAAGGSRVTIFVVDYDREGSQGYGSPDAVVKIAQEIVSGSDLYTMRSLRTQLLEPLYDSPENPTAKPERQKPKDREIYTSIVKMGEASLDIWEQGVFTVPFDYKGLTSNLEIVFLASKSSDKGHEKLKQIEHFLREFKQDGKVVVREYWLPKKDYQGPDVSFAVALSDTIKIRKTNSPEENAEIGYFSERVRAIDYQFGGKCIRIMDEDGDGKFEKRRVIACPSGMLEAPASNNFGPN